MGTWGTALFSDDLAADLRNDLRALLGDGVPVDAAVDRLVADHETALGDPDEAPVFWLAVAYAAWKLGRPSARATTEALTVISSGRDLARWREPNDRRKRQAVLARIESDLRSDAPAAKRIAPTFVADNQWEVGELIAYRLASGKYALFRVIGHHVDKGGRHAVCEPLDWIEDAPPSVAPNDRVRQRTGAGSGFAQFLLGEPRRKKDQARLVRTGLSSAPEQSPQGYAVFVFPHVDRLLAEIFGLE
jgi:hypothetical protein